MSKLELLEEAKNNYINIIAEIEDSTDPELRQSAKSIIGEVIVHEAIALETFEDQVAQ